MVGRLNTSNGLKNVENTSQTLMVSLPTHWLRIFIKIISKYVLFVLNDEISYDFWPCLSIIRII